MIDVHSRGAATVRGCSLLLWAGVVHPDFAGLLVSHWFGAANQEGVVAGALRGSGHRPEAGTANR